MYRTHSVSCSEVEISAVSSCQNTQFEEVYVFLALTMLMARNKKLEISDYWSTDPLLHQTIFGEHMRHDRYLLLLRMLHFSNNDDQILGDRLSKIRMPLQDITKNFKNAMIPFENLAIDESLVLWKVRLS